ncbi:lipid A biosynthesis lauroyl acyltransferase [Nitratireductor basaltis]|uniref:Lipid A biosynthesis lauroyl acyltransferase n=1 Tax=Nitratireductor basaltis TaxID=472175 RepID=A0A084UA19_9HYPH|nr:lipid A biosynthesis lauroyl acyltransferase [Nitratireductor basaltis]KFB09805.1 Lipid A biosynthesis lauroyl acyltransferase [Nitratireductor basaltis]
MKPFIAKLLRGLKQAEYWVTARFALTALFLLRLLPMESAMNFAERVARRLGPLFGRHRVATSNLRAAYPEKSDEEIEAIASDMWANMARLAVEYIYLDRLFDYDPDAAATGRVEVEGAEIFERIRTEGGPHIFFTAHLGNFEFLPIAASTFGLSLTALFRPPNNPYIADYIYKTRSSSMGGLLASRAGAALQLARVLEKGGNVGALVDQKFMRGVPTTFFGRPCQTSPLVPKLARQYECDVYPARCIRLPDGRYRLEIEERLRLPHLTDGEVDVPAMAQMLNDTVERWVREDPGQWMWFHKRWQIR